MNANNMNPDCESVATQLLKRKCIGRSESTCIQISSGVSDNYQFGRYYCSKACQVSDWPSHKQHHINLSKAAGDATVENLGGDFRSLAASGCSDAGSRIREERDADGATPLILKAAHGDLKGVEELLTAGADPAAVDDQGLSALHYASYLGHVKVVRALIAHTKSSYLIQLAPPNGVNSLLLAAQEGHLSIVEALAKACGDALLMSAEDGASCLYIASQNGHLEVVKFLCKAGGEVLLMKTMADGRTCLGIASQEGHLEVVRALCKAGGAALLMNTRKDGFSCLHAAAAAGHVPVVDHLARLGGPDLLRLQLNSGPRAGATALGLARARGHAAVCAALVAAAGGGCG